MFFDNTYVTVDLNIIAENFRAIREKAGVPVMAVIKANAYGHGAIPVARALENVCPFFGVATMAEALELRKAKILTPILILGQIPTAAFETAITEDIRPVIFRWEDAVALSEAAVKSGKTALFHLAVDTGMSRIGFQVTDVDICAEICRLPGVKAEGIFSHFATADSEDLTKSREQSRKFDAFVEALAERGITFQIQHMDNSAAILHFTDHRQMVRSGIVTYGLYPGEGVDRLALEPALRWYSRVTHIKTLEAGREIGYGGTFTTTKPTVVATVSTGYGDGYRWSLSNKFYVLIGGRRAPILGRICMDQMMVDVTDIPDVSVGDRVVLIGKDGDEEIRAEQIAAAAGSFNYEFVSGISRRVPRIYLQDGQIVQQVHYLLDNCE